MRKSLFKDRTIKRNGAKKLDKVIARILSTGQKVLKSITRRNTEDKVNEQSRIKKSKSTCCY
jgi:hypothetical protein